MGIKNILSKIKDAAAAAGEVNYMFQEITDVGEFVYTNLETGFNENFPEKIPGAKNNPTDDEIEKLLYKPSNPDFDETEIRKEGLYPKSNFKQPAQYDIEDGKKSRAEKKSPSSMVNNWSLINYRGDGDINYNKAMLGAGKNSAGILPVINPTANVIIEKCRNKGSGSYLYSKKDFVFCEYYGKIPNNYMLTLRRFAYPVEDNIIDPKVFSIKLNETIENIQPPLAQAVTWMSSTVGNELKDILKFDVGYQWKKAEAGIQEINSRDGSGRNKGMIGGFMDGLPGSQMIAGSMKGESASTTYRRKHASGWDPIKDTYPNHTFAPLNVIKEMQVRESGLTFKQSFSLVFCYDLKGIPNTSPKVALLDVLSNLLVLTYSNAPFWGGAVRHIPGNKAGKPLGDLKKLQSGDYKGFLGSIMSDIKAGFGALTDDLSKLGDSKLLNNMLGGGLMELFGGPQGGQAVQAMLTGEATGQWHLTVGNPLNPIAVIGNLGCTDAKFAFEGPLGYEDFPTKLKVTIELAPNRPRDKSDIESMFNAGKGRLYVPEQGVFDVGQGSYEVSAYGNKDNGGSKFPADALKKAAKLANG